MKILHIINNLGSGGAEKLLVSFLEHNVGADRHELCLLYRTPRREYQCLLERGIIVHTLNYSRKYHCGIIIKLCRLLAGNHYDLVHVHLFPAQYFVAIAACFIKSPVYLFTEHNSYNRRRAWRFFRYLDSLSYLPYQKIICISQAAQKDLHLWLPQLIKKTITIYNGVLIEKPCETEIIYDLALVGSLRSKVKGVDLLLKALSGLKNTIGKVAIAGDGIHRQELVQQRNELGLQEQVEFLGNITDVRRLLAQSKIFVMPSRWEGFPIALLEAMAARKPVIASQVGGIPEVVVNEHNGILVPPEDAPALAAAIARLLADESLALQMAEQAFADVCANYSIKTYIIRLHDLYHAMRINSELKTKCSTF